MLFCFLYLLANMDKSLSYSSLHKNFNGVLLENFVILQQLEENFDMSDTYFKFDIINTVRVKSLQSDTYALQFYNGE